MPGEPMLKWSSVKKCYKNGSRYGKFLRGVYLCIISVCFGNRQKSDYHHGKNGIYGIIS